MFKLYTDKNNTFKCKVKVEGASESNALARLIIEGETHNLMFEGKLRDNVCEVNIGKFKNFDNFKSRGYVKLEIIADDTYFTPWKSEYEVEQSKNVVIEVIEEKKDLKPLVEITEVSYIKDTVEVSSDNHGEKIHKLLMKEHINLETYKSLDDMLKQNKKAKALVKNYITEHITSNDILESTLSYLVDKFY